MSTSPGAPRSSHGTSRTSRSRRPVVGDRRPRRRARRAADGRARRRTTRRRASPPSARQRGDHALDRLGRQIGPVGEDDDRRLDGRRRAPRARSASDAPGPRFQPAQVTTRAGVSSVCAPATTTTSSTELCVSRSSTSGSSSRCFGVPNRDASPAASTTAATITAPRPSPTRSRRAGSAARSPGSPSSPIRSTTSRPLVTVPTIA